MMKILCRADGNAEMGLGHIYRMLAVAEFYKEDYELVFVTKENSLKKIIPTEFNLEKIPIEVSIKEEPAWLFKRFSPSEYIIIADGYQFVSAYQATIKNFGYGLLYIDDLMTEHMYADVVINHAPHCNIAQFKAEKYTRFALGTSYAMLRPMFNEASKNERVIDRIKNAFVCFGGVDSYDLSLKATKALLNIDQIEQIHVVLGEAYNHQKIHELKNDQLYLHKNLDGYDLSELMQSCQIAIASASTILFEICSVKMPVLGGYYVENQQHIYNQLAEDQVIFKGGNFTKYSSLDFQKKIESILNSDEIPNYLINQQELFKGKSKEHFLSLMNHLTISFRKATEDDLELVYNWSNDKIVRENSFNSKPIKFEDHKKWFNKKIIDKNTLFLIALINSKPAGIVRYEVKDANAVVGILISESFRGQKLASSFLKKSASLYFCKFKLPILAFIKEKNRGSIKSFERANYRLMRKELVEGNLSFVYKLEEQDVI